MVRHKLAALYSQTRPGASEGSEATKGASIPHVLALLVFTLSTVGSLTLPPFRVCDIMFLT